MVTAWPAAVCRTLFCAAHRRGVCASNRLSIPWQTVRFQSCFRRWYFRHDYPIQSLPSDRRFAVAEDRDRKQKRCMLFPPAHCRSKRPGRNGNPIKECTVQKYLETVSSVLEDAKKNDIIPFNPAHRVRKKCAEKEKQHIPQKHEMQRLLKIIMDEPILYKAYYTMAIATGLRRGELCALRWEDITGPYEFTIRHSRSYVAGQGIVESDTKNHRERVIVIPAQVWEFLMSLRHWQTIRSGKPENNQPIFTDLDGHVPNPDTFTRHLRRLYAKNGFPQEYHLHTLRHYYATYLLQEGTSKQVAADLLGHADTAFLERTYCHPQNMAKREVANLMEDLLSPKNIYYQPFKWVLKGKKVG